jgi:hypothetical protein
MTSTPTLAPAEGSVATRLGKSVRYLVASPAYLKNGEQPAEPADLAQHDCVMLNAKNNEADRSLPLRLSAFLQALAAWSSPAWMRE